jgi:dienelactone hydrolase
MTHRSWRRAATTLALCLVAGCTVGSAVHDSATPSTLELRQVPGAGFTHAVLVSGGEDPGAPRFVFLEGDGRPWSPDGRRPASDPDPQRAIASELAFLEQHGSVVLGRPCYHGRFDDPGCRPELWTSGRYSPTVVASMAAALDELLAALPPRPVVLVGYSGGGALALLVSERRPEVRAVVTLAANLDLEAWTNLHGYLPLDGSLDPLAVRALRPGCEIHIAAARDRVVPPELARSALPRRPGAVLWLEPRADHACCWSRRWPEIEERVLAQLASAGCLA